MRFIFIKADFFGRAWKPSPTILHKRFCVILCLPRASGGGLHKQLREIVINIVEDPQLFILQFSIFIIHQTTKGGRNCPPCDRFNVVKFSSEATYCAVFDKVLNAL